MNVETILRTKSNEIVSIRPDAPVSEAVSLLKAKRIGAVIVSRDGLTVDGILSERDIVRALDTRASELMRLPVSELMTTRVTTCSPSDGIDALMTRMTEGRFRHMPVMRDGRLCGVVSIGDVVKHRIEEVEFEASSLKSFITSA
jgi:CBS domain-containing protein